MASCYKCNEIFSFNNYREVANSENERLLIENPIPPKKIKYNVKIKEINGRDKEEVSKIEYVKLNFSMESIEDNMYPWINTECFSIPNSQSNNLILMKISNTFVKEKNFTIFYSHENFVDLSDIFPFLIDLSTHLKVRNK